MGFSLILRAFFSFPNERQFIECQFFWEFREEGECTHDVHHDAGMQGDGHDLSGVEILLQRGLGAQRETG